MAEEKQEGQEEHEVFGVIGRTMVKAWKNAEQTLDRESERGRVSPEILDRIKTLAQATNLIYGEFLGGFPGRKTQNRLMSARKTGAES